ncbi:MAG: hypothetical protein LUD53_06850 [Clostridiales bacterium]|nr:hypothetical protein [Clostridiales bacterium]
MSKRKENQHNPLYPDRIESNAKGVLVAVISVIVAIILLAVIVVNFSYASGRRRSSGTDSYEEEMNQTDTAVEEDIAEPEETVDSDVEETGEADEEDLPEADIDAVTDTYAQFTGILTGSTDAYAVILEGAYTIYAYNDADEPVVMDDVNQIILIETGDADLARYVGEEVTVGG